MPEQPPTNDRRGLPIPDLPLIIEQLQDQLDQLRVTVEAQQEVIERHSARLAALERS